MADPFAKLYRRLRSDPAWQSLGDAACRVLVEYIMLSYPYDGQNRGVVCTPGDTASGLTTQPLSQAGRAKAVGRSRGALRRIEEELEAAGCITLRSMGEKRPTVVCLAGWCIDETSEHDSQRVMFEPTEHDSPGVMNMTHSESCCAQNMTHDESCTRLTVSHVEAEEPKGPTGSAGAREDVREVQTQKGGEKDAHGPPDRASRSSTATADGTGGTATADGSEGATGVPIAANGKQRTATAPLSETTRGTTEATATELPLAELIQQVTGTRPTSEKNAELVAGIVASRKATEAELRLALVECRPEASEYAREWMPRAEHWCQERRAANLRRLVSETIGRLNAAPNVAARWEIMQEVWSAHEELRPPREGEGRNQALESVQEATGFTAVNDWGLEQALRDEQGEAWMATHPEWAAMAEQRAADAQEERSRRFRERMAETMRQIGGGSGRS